MSDQQPSPPPRDPQQPPDQGPGGQKPGGEAPQPRRSIMPLLLVAALITLLVMMMGPDVASDYREVSIGKLQAMAAVPPSQNKLLKITRVGNEEYRGELLGGTEEITADGKRFSKFRVQIASAEAGQTLSETLDPKLADLLGENFTHERSQTRLTQLLAAVLPWILILGLMWFLFFRRIGGAGMGGPGGLFGFTRSRAKMHSKETVNVTFKDVAGIEEASEEVAEIIQFLKNPEKFRRIGGRIPRGVLLIGQPGTGKTLLAKAIAGEAGVPFFSISGSDFVEMFVGVGASRVRDLFRQAKENAPCIIFLDEIDAVGRRRGTGLGGGHDEREQTLNAILVEMDGFDTEQGIIVVAATNRPDVLDPALLRPGRFDRQISIDLPDIRGREQILRVHARKIKLDPSVDLRRLARGTPGFSGAELANLVNEAAIIAAMRNLEQVPMSCFEEARDKVKFGREKRSRVIPEKELKITAYHEAGHAVVQHFMPDTDAIHKVTIIPRGMAAGATMSLPEEDRHNYSRTYLTSFLAVAFGGRIAEKLIFNEITTGASQDIKQATEIAKRMVCEWGMSDKVGPLNYSDSEEHMFLGREVARTTNHGEEVTQMIDEETRRLITEAQENAERLLTEHREQLEVLTQALMEFETLPGEEIVPLLDGEMTLEELRKIRPRVPRRLMTTGEQEAKWKEEESADADDGDADDGDRSDTPGTSGGEGAEATTASVGADGTASGDSSSKDDNDGDGLPVPRSMGGDDK